MKYLALEIIPSFLQFFYVFSTMFLNCNLSLYFISTTWYLACFKIITGAIECKYQVNDSHEKNNKSNLKKFDESNRTYQNNTQRWNDQSNLSNNPISLLMVCFLKKMKRHLLEMMDGLDLRIALLKRYQHLHQHHPHKSCLITSINSAN